jgi:hypothetical protein
MIRWLQRDDCYALPNVSFQPAQMLFVSSRKRLSVVAEGAGQGPV